MMKRNHVFKLSLLVVAFLAIAATFFAQSGAQKDASKPLGVVAPNVESEREGMITNQLSFLLAATGISVAESAAMPQGQGYQEARVRWDSNTKPTPGEVSNTEQRSLLGSLTIKEKRNREGLLPRQRALELSTNQVFIVAIDAEKKLHWWTLVPDPRVLRAEAPGPDGELYGQTLMLQTADFAIAYPDDPAIVELRLYHPHWNGERFTLELIGAVTVQ